MNCHMCKEHYPLPPSVRGKSPFIRGLCPRCYAKSQRKGNIDKVGLPANGFIGRKMWSKSPKPDGYISIKTPDDGVIAEHRHIMQVHLGRKLIRGENVHHINGDRADNRPENLELWVATQPSGQRVEDLARYMVDFHREAIIDALQNTREPAEGYNL